MYVPMPVAPWHRGLPSLRQRGPPQPSRGPGPKASLTSRETLPASGPQALRCWATPPPLAPPSRPNSCLSPLCCPLTSPTQGGQYSLFLGHLLGLAPMVSGHEHHHRHQKAEQERGDHTHHHHGGRHHVHLLPRGVCGACRRQATA